jgi:DhnA family fructose-bisphosphate aldolase class Ia
LCLGADFVKLSYPSGESEKEAEKFKKVTTAGENTGIIFSGGAKISEAKLLKTIKNQIKISGARGCAIGRNVHQNDLKTAVSLANKIEKLMK